LALALVLVELVLVLVELVLVQGLVLVPNNPSSWLKGIQYYQ